MNKVLDSLVDVRILQPIWTTIVITLTLFTVAALGLHSLWESIRVQLASSN